MKIRPLLAKAARWLIRGAALAAVFTALFFIRPVFASTYNTPTPTYGDTNYTPTYGTETQNANTNDNLDNTKRLVNGDSPYTIGINVTSNTDDSKGLTSTLRIMLALTLIALSPSILIMLTSFTRIIVVLHFLRSALSTQTSPPNQVLIGLALFLTWFIMFPTFEQVRTQAIVPLEQGTITAEEAYAKGIEPVRTFMFKQTNTKDIKLFVDIEGLENVKTMDDIPTHVLVPAFIISELRAAFIIGFCLYIPFIIIDMVVASALMSMGMMMLPPTTISMPFKILLFVMVDGWDLVIGNLVKSYVR
ncbi:MAG: flagellar type III secretion system pore protein FliP [Catonella sp.]|jgi:flagellar biosynthetic protein FliP|nr:flagellar type III secretion system pore protein FliP [Catonella sp.]MDY6356167.1 flagellar type III secretion system pore protein FliP [Catonella sp.]